MIKTISVILIFAVAGVAFAQEDEKPDSRDNLVEAKSSFQETWISPDADLSKYNSVHLWQAHFEYRDVGPARRSRGSFLSSRKREFGIHDEDRAKFEELVSQIFEEEVNKGKTYSVVTDPGAGTLLVRGAMLDIISRVPPEMIGAGEVYLASIGEATLVIELLDAITGETVALVSERRAIQPPGGGRIDEFSMPTNRVTVLADIRRWARRLASKLRKELDKSIGD